MNLDTLLRAAQILRDQPCHAMPLSRLHSRLTDDLGRQAGSYGEVYHALKKRPQSFMVLEPDPLLEPGLGSYVHVTLIEDMLPDPSDIVSMATDTLNELWQSPNADSTIRDYLMHAADQVQQLKSAVTQDGEAERPTIRARDPHP